MADIGYSRNGKPELNVLGILCELAIEDRQTVATTEQDPDFKKFYRAYDGERYVLPDSVIQWAGMKNCAAIWEVGTPGLLAMHDRYIESKGKEIAAVILEKQKDL